MSIPLDKRPEYNQSVELRPTTAFEIEEYLIHNWNKIDISIHSHGEKGVVSEGWHGEGFKYEARVNFRDLLTTPIAGTELDAPNFTNWLESKGFMFERGNQWLSASDAATLLASDESSEDGVPVFRAWRKRGVPIQVEFYAGSKSPMMQRLSELGNRHSLDPIGDASYRGIVANLSEAFISKGTTKVAEHMGLPPGYRRDARKDDCEATGGTYVAHKMISALMDIEEKRQEPLFWVDDAAVVTTQAAVNSIVLSEMYATPLLIRAGAASFGLGGSEADLNYMRNTQKELLRFGPLTSGDFGEHMTGGQGNQWEPAHIRYGHGSPLRNTIFFLRGGGPIMDMMFASLDAHKKRHQGMLSIVQAKRIDHGPMEWSVVIDGIYPIHEDEFYPQYRIEPGSILRFSKYDDGMIRRFPKGEIAQFVREEDGYRVLRVMIEGEMRVLYELMP